MIHYEKVQCQGRPAYRDVNSGMVYVKESDPVEFQRVEQELRSAKAIVVDLKEERAAKVRAANYAAEGVTIEQMTVALWEHIVEMKPGSFERLEEMQRRRVAVKERLPKR